MTKPNQRPEGKVSPGGGAQPEPEAVAADPDPAVRRVVGPAVAVAEVGAVEAVVTEVEVVEVVVEEEEEEEVVLETEPSATPGLEVEVVTTRLAPPPALSPWPQPATVNTTARAMATTIGRSQFSPHPRSTMV